MLLSIDTTMEIIAAIEEVARVGFKATTTCIGSGYRHCAIATLWYAQYHITVCDVHNTELNGICSARNMAPKNLVLYHPVHPVYQ